MVEDTPIHEELVPLIADGKPAQQGLFIWNEDDAESHLTLRYAGKEITATESDYFEAMCSIRKILEAEDLIPFCYGASRTAYPSAMGRDMGSGLLVYKLKMGEPARTSDLVKLFASGPDVEPSSVTEQQAFYKDWCASIHRQTI